MERRIFGIENEYGITCTFDGQRRLTPDEVARYLFRKVVSWGRSSQRLPVQRLPALPGRRGPTPSTPPPSATTCASSSSTTRRGSGSSRAWSPTPRSGSPRRASQGEIYVFKNNTDSAGNSYGCHENYLVGRAGEFQQLSDVLIPFLVSRQITCGAGKVVTTSKGATYCVSQRADHIWEGVSSRDNPLPADHQHPGRAARRRRAATGACTSSSATPT